jgi:hypothetical protein
MTLLLYEASPAKIDQSSKYGGSLRHVLRYLPTIAVR